MDKEMNMKRKMMRRTEKALDRQFAVMEKNGAPREQILTIIATMIELKSKGIDFGLEINHDTRQVNFIEYVDGKVA